jgi:F-type H+-transporting ATPase subunit delta
MAGGFSAKRFATAIFELARERGELERWQADLAELDRLREDAALVSWLDNPKAGFEQKREYLDGVLTTVSPLARNLVYLLIHRGQLARLAEIRTAYEAHLNDHLGRLPARISSAVPLDAQTVAGITARLSAITGRDVVVRTDVDPSLVGGFVARIGDRLLDGSTRSNLRALGRSIAGKT